jgi:hypothetical protein
MHVLTALAAAPRPRAWDLPDRTITPDAYENPARSAGAMVLSADHHAIVIFLGMHVVVT